MPIRVTAPKVPRRRSEAGTKKFIERQLRILYDAHVRSMMSMKRYDRLDFLGRGEGREEPESLEHTRRREEDL